MPQKAQKAVPFQQVGPRTVFVTVCSAGTRTLLNLTKFDRFS